MVNNKAQEILSDAIDRLDQESKELINLHLYDGMSNCQIADLLDCEETTVRRKLKKAIKIVSVYCKSRQGELCSIE